MSFDVTQFFICFNSGGEIVKIKSDFAFASFDSHATMASGGSVGFTQDPFTYVQVSFFMSNASTWIFQVSKFSLPSGSIFTLV